MTSNDKICGLLILSVFPMGFLAHFNTLETVSLFQDSASFGEILTCAISWGAIAAYWRFSHSEFVDRIFKN